MNDILQHKGYYAEVHFSAEDEVFFGKIIGISDLVNFEADSVKALKKEFANAVTDYIATSQELDKVSNKTYKGSFNVRIPSALHKEAVTCCFKKSYIKRICSLCIRQCNYKREISLLGHSLLNYHLSLQH
jgi:predicted HicB family RNase H-like nuclease